MAVDAGSLFYSVDARTEGLMTAERQVNQSTRRMESNLGRAEKATRGFNGSVSDALGPLGNLKTLVGAIASAMAVQRVIAYADAWTNAQNSIRQVTGSQQELTQVTDRLLAVANESRTSFVATSDLYGRLARSTQGLGVSQDRLIRLTETINKGFASSGATAQEAENAIVQLGQGLASGALRGEEFNSVAEQAPVILRAVAAQTGKTIGELRDFAAQGGITADLLIKSLEGYADAVESDFSKAVATFGQQTTVANNNLTEFIGNSQAVRTAVSSAGSTLVYLSENIDDVASVASLAATTIGVRLVQALSASIARQAASAVGASSLTAAYSTMGARAATTAVAVRGLSAAMAVVGGPVGVAILAATAIYQFRDSIFGATDPTARLSARVRELTGDIDNLTAAQIDNKIADFGGTLAQLEVQADAARKQVRAAQEQLNDNSLSNSGALGVSGVNISGYSEAQQELGRITSEINAQSTAIEELNARKSELGNRENTSSGVTSLPEANTSGNGASRAAQEETENVERELSRRRDMVVSSLSTESEAAYREYQERNLEIQSLFADGSQQQRELLQRNNEQYAETVAQQNQRELEQKQAHQQELLRLEQEANIARIAELTGFTEQAAAKLYEFQQNAANPIQYLTDSMQNAFVSLDDTISDTFTNGIRQGESFGEIMANVGRSIVADLLQSLVKLGVQMAINAAVGQTAQGAAVAGAAASGAAMAASYAPAAALASLASFGANAAPASAALASTVALSQGLAMAGGRQYGGNVNAGSMYRVTEDGKPEMYSDGSRSYLLPGRNGKVTANKDMGGEGGGQTVLNVQLIGKGAENATVNQTRDSAGNQVTQIILADMQENGPISRGFKNNFNVSRRGN